jgi:hypothetical protein
VWCDATWLPHATPHLLLQNANMLKYLAAHDGKWDAESYASGLMLDFGPGSEYDQFGQLDSGIDQ